LANDLCALALPAMSFRALPLFSSIALLILGGCGGIMEKDRMTETLEATLATYGEAMRWGRFETLYRYVHPDKRIGIPENIDNLRIIGYEVLEAPLMRDEKSAEQLVRIRYVHEDRQQLRSLSDRQLWTYDETTNGWWLDSGIPRFGGG